MEYKNTPLIQEHQALGAKLAPFGGWMMPIQYEGIIAEHSWTREKCALFDICHMGEFLVFGDPIRTWLETAVTQNLSTMKTGSCRYGFMLSQDGGIIDDVIVYKLDDAEWMLVVNAATSDNDFVNLQKILADDSGLKNISDNTAKLDLQGPLSRDVLKKIVGRKIEELKYYRSGKFSVLGSDCIISRTGYTGELGYELYISNDKVKELWQLLLKDEQVKPAGLGARDTLRLEMSYPLYGQDIDRESSPKEAGLDKFVDLNKEFVGKQALLDKNSISKKRGLCCFIAQSRRAPRHNYRIYDGENEIGIVTSGSFSPSLAKGIGMGYVDENYLRLDTHILLKEGNVEISATIVDKPFYKKGTARI